jgi:alpha-beta hydrolase superfamily lysophospholipase
MYMNSHSWQPWVERATARGFETVAPSWPFHSGKPAELRAAPDPGLGKLTFGEVVGNMKAVIDGMPERPHLVGHSIGGLVVQKLVNDGYARTGVAISSAPPQGLISFDPHFFRANFPHVNPFAGNKPVLMTPERFHYTFCNTMTVEATATAFDEYVVPESRNVPRSTLTKQASIDFAAAHVPLLFIAGDTDHLTPMSLVKKNVKKYRASGSTLDYTSFVDRSHFICNQEGWEDVADYAFDWIERAHPETAPREKALGE